jgi:murein DD-endopeptidase MepM/ murein hydrolase activator NlpD
MFRLPAGYSTITDLYNNTEIHRGGHYPLGVNNSWHSGVHLHFSADMPMNPFLGGTVVACRLNTGYQAIPLPAEVDGDEYRVLSRGEQELYDGETYKPGEIQTIKLRKITEDNYKELSPAAKKCVEKHPDGYTPVDLFSNDFVLMRHSVMLPEKDGEQDTAHSNERETIIFFCLYLGFNNVITRELSPFYNGFIDKIPPLPRRRLPFFQKWVFKIIPDVSGPYSNDQKYHEIAGTKIFQYSTCVIKGENANDYQCVFTNCNSEAWVPKGKLAVTRLIYKPAKENVEIYKIPLQGQLPNFKTTTLKQNAAFSTVSIWDRNANYYRAEVQYQECNKASFLGWIRSNVPVIGGRNSKQNICITGQVFPYTITQTVPSHIRAVNLWEYLRHSYPSRITETKHGYQPVLEYNKKAVQITLSDDGKLVTGFSIIPRQEEKALGTLTNESTMILLERAASGEQYSFYYNGKKTITVKVSREEFDAFKGNSWVPGLASYKWTKVGGVTAGDYVDIDGQIPVPPSKNLPEHVQSEEGIKACCFTYYQYPNTNVTDYPILVKKEDLRLEQGNAWLSDISFCEQMAPGYIYYDSTAARTAGNNARGMFEGGDEFEMVDPYAFSGAGVVPVRVGNDIRYLDLTAGAQLKAKIVIKDAYKGKNSIVLPGEKITGSDIIGYPTNHPHENADGCYDFAVFFTGDDFLRDTSRIHNAQTACYTIPPETQKYTCREHKEKAYYFPPGTVFNAAPEGDSNKLTVKSIPLYFRGRDVKKTIETVNGKDTVFYTITTPPTAVYLMDSDTRIDCEQETSEPENEAAREFGRGFRLIRPLLKDKKLEHLENGQGGTVRLRLDFEEQGIPFDMTLWAKKDYGKLQPQGDFLTTAIGRTENLKLYNENPDYALFEEAGKTEEEITCKAEEEKNEKGTGTRIYYGFKDARGSLFYVAEDAKDLERKNYLDWEEFFTLDGTDSDGDLVCDIDKEVRKIESLSAGQDGYQLSDGIITRRELEEFFKRRCHYQDLVEGFRRYVCRHPLEWDKTKYDEGFKNKLWMKFNLNGERFTRLQERAEKLDIWEGIKNLDDIKRNGTAENNFWFAHPVYFLNHLDKAGLLDRSFNPYEGKPFGEGEYKVTVRDNPGFAPVWEHRDGESDEGWYKGPDGQSYAVVTYPFNKIIPREGMNSYRHEGVDFRGAKGREIRSFIYAQVIGYGWGIGSLRPYGKTLILGNTNGEGIYLLGHLDEFIPDLGPGSLIVPGDIVGKVGKSGYGDLWYSGFDGPHLHVSYFDAQYDPRKTYLNIVEQAIDFGVDISKDMWGQRLRNPFDHIKEKIKG